MEDQAKETELLPGRRWNWYRTVVRERKKRKRCLFLFIHVATIENVNVIVTHRNRKINRVLSLSYVNRVFIYKL